MARGKRAWQSAIIADAARASRRHAASGKLDVRV
jgi:hypothetical protein